MTARFQEVCEFRNRSLLKAGSGAPAEQSNTALCSIPKDDYKEGMSRSELESLIKSYECRTKTKGKVVVVRDMKVYGGVDVELHSFM